jgi:hypothetical protein
MARLNYSINLSSFFKLKDDRLKTVFLAFRLLFFNEKNYKKTLAILSANC